MLFKITVCLGLFLCLILPGLVKDYIMEYIVNLIDRTKKNRIKKENL